MPRSLAIAAARQQPLDAAELIPLAAAGRQPLFFYGTLMDLDVLTYVLGRPVDLDDLQPAALAGFGRFYARGASYPVLRPLAGGMVEGRLLRRATRRDIARVNHYESGEYRAELHAVATGDGGMTAAWLYLGLDHLAGNDEAWHLEGWQERDKPGYVAACDGWMDDVPGCD